MEERRLLLAVALSLVVLTAYSLLFPPAPEAEKERRTTEVTTPVVPTGAVETPDAEDGDGDEVQVSVEMPGGAAIEPALALVAAEEEKRIEVLSRDIEIAFTNRGAELLSWRLNGFLDEKGQPEEMVQTFPEKNLPLSIETGEVALDKRIREALFVASGDSLRVVPSTETVLRFEYVDADLSVEKTLRIAGEGYMIGVSATVQYRGQSLPVSMSWGPGVANPSAATREVRGFLATRGVSLNRDGEVERHTAESIGEGREVVDVTWAGLGSKYFTALWVLPEGPGRGHLSVVTVPADAISTRPEPIAAIEIPPAGEVLLYVGPQDYFILKELGHDLARVVDLGDWIGPIVVPLMRLLRWAHGHIGNYGWAIVALTVLINLVMAPLRHISISNGVKMAKLSPEMKVIQERYRKVPALDPKRQEMQKEMAALYARHGMSMSTQLTVGCLPLLLTMPFLIGFYNLLAVFIELRGASFLWIPDLSHKDPLYLTPLLMGASMFAMQRMTPSTLEPAQQRMMMIMPLMFLVMFMSAPAGLNLYWLSSNVCSMVQQTVTQSVIRRREDAVKPKARGPSKEKGSRKERKRK
jgi:YidC/Oxa1 family membrane protein insertase